MLLQIKLILNNLIFHSLKAYTSHDIMNEQRNIVLIFKLNSSFLYDKLYCWMHTLKVSSQQLLFLLLLFPILLQIFPANCSMLSYGSFKGFYI